MSNNNGFLNFLRIIGRGVNGTRIVILNLIFFGFLALLFGGMAQKESVTVAEDNVLLIQPVGMLVEQFSIDPVQRALAKASDQEIGQVRLRDLLRGIDAAASDARIDSILLVPDQLQASGFAGLREVGKALDRFRAAGKKVNVWSAGMDQAQFYLASHADRIMLDPQGGVLLTGLSSVRPYFKALLDKLGVTVHLFRVGQFKSAAEPYVLNHASPESKKADAYWMGGLWDTLLSEIAANRGVDEAKLRAAIDNMPELLVEAGGSLARMGQQQNLVDDLMTRPEMRQWMRENGQPDEKDSFRQIALERYLTAIGKTPVGQGKKIAVVVAEGAIVAGSQSPGKIGGATTAKQIRDVRNDDSVAALVLRIDSPGGAVYPSERIRRQVELTRKAGKPVIVSMGDMAASGGYWIAMNANRILAEPNTITGSIGIFGLFPTVPEGLAKIGVSTDGVETAPWADAWDFRRKMDPRVGQMMQSILDKGYRDFVGQVAAARGTSFEAIDAVAQGRVWTGQQALERGLVDQLGGIRDAIKVAAETADLGDAYQVSFVDKPLSPLESFFTGFNRGRGGALLQSLGLGIPASWLQLAEQSPMLDMLTELKPGQPTVMARCFCRLQ